MLQHENNIYIQPLLHAN